MDPAGQQKTFQILAAVGAALLLFFLVFNVYLVWRNVDLYRESHRKAVRLQKIDNDVREWQALFQELVEYSKTHPAIDPVLQKYFLKPPSASSKPQ